MTFNKTDRIVITLGKQIVHGKYVPGSFTANTCQARRFRLRQNSVRSLQPRATSSVRYFVR